MNKKEIPMDFNEDFAIDIDGEYNPELATSVRRRYSYSITDNEMVKTRKTHVGNMSYVVNSIFDMTSKKKVEDHIRRLITIDIQDNIDKVS